MFCQIVHEYYDLETNALEGSLWGVEEREGKKPGCSPRFCIQKILEPDAASPI